MVVIGKIGREFYEIEDVRNNFYMVGFMGCVSFIGLGLVLSRNEKNIIIIDGDGVLFMCMGNLVINGYYCLVNLLYIFLDN